MLKLFLFAAVVANGILLVSSGGCRKCKKNEVPSDCVNGGCDARNCSQLGKPVPCVKLDSKDCIKGCICASGYLRADNGTCIKIEKCPSCGDDPNAVSGCGVFCQKCSNHGSKCPIACPEFCKVNGCECRKGFIYDENTKKCVRPNQCTPTCKKNEILSGCINGGCDVRNCSQLGFPVECAKVDPDDCIPGCICKPDHLRADNGTCILVKDCPSCGGDNNATKGCGVFCKQCRGNVPCPRICRPNSCDCKPGFVYDSNIKKCVKKNDCTPTCKANEVFSTCINGGCDARNCTQLGNPVPCIKMDPKYCKQGCVCDKGYLRAKNGTCVPKKECPSCGGDPNATSGCGVFCNRCSGPIPCPKICKVNGCDCKDGYVYDDNTKKCTLPEKCTKPCTQPNEVYSDCLNSNCQAKNCSQLGQPIPCDGPEPCVKGCTCVDGYVRADNGTCIPILECPSCGGDPNAVTGCGVFCRRCSNYNSTGPIACPASCQLNGCDCRDGFVYDDVTKRCVKPEDCSPKCGVNEVNSGCINGRCGHTYCSDLGGPILCVDPPPGGCIKGCLCAEGYLRTENGTCVAEKDCPCKGDPNAQPGCGGYCTRCSNYKDGPIACKFPCQLGGCDCREGFIYDDIVKRCVKPEDCSIPTPTCPPCEVFSNCSNSYCDARNCSELGKQVPCVDISEEDCVKGCICEPGYVRDDKNGTCIPKTSCPSCNDDPNAGPGCGGFCTRCDNYKNPIPCPPLCILNGCDCKEGFIYDQNIKKCVQPEKCSETCKENEVFHDCVNSNCLLRSCSQVGKALRCDDPDKTTCKKGCICAPGFLRADNGTCIPVDQCPSCNGDPNAEIGCGSFCERCSNYGEKKRCPIGCIYNGCQCKKGFIYDQNRKLCVRPDQCTPTCKENEEYSDCANGICRLRDCSQYGQPIPFCPRFDEAKCKPGCICKNKYLKNKKGVCISQEECPGKQCKENEVLEQCPQTCPFRTCGIDDNLIDCKPGPVIGDPDCPPPKCRCKPQFFRDDKGNCVPWEQCPKCLNPNEEYSPCFSPCGQDRCDFDPTVVKCIPPPSLGDPGCVAGCRCSEGFLRNGQGVCVTRDQCQCGGDPNAKPGCGGFCTRCSNYKKGPVACALACQLGGCDCRKGYIYDDVIGKCVVPGNCTIEITPTEEPPCEEYYDDQDN